MPKYISGRSKLTPQNRLKEERYKYLSVADAEPNLGEPLVGPSSIGAKPVPVGQQYVIVSVPDNPASFPGERYWIPNQGGLIPGSITVYDEGFDNLVGGLSSTTQLNFIGAAITAQGYLNPDFSPAPNVDITVFSPGNNTEILFNSSNDFSTDIRFTFDDGLLTAGDRITVGSGGTVITTTGIGSVGIGTTQPTQKLHIQGDIRLTGTIYDSNNQPGETGYLITKTADGGILWVTEQSVITGAGGTIGQIQFHSNSGLVDGADNFYYDFSNQRVGIGSTQPTKLLDVLGISTFSGGVFVDNLNVSGFSTFLNNVNIGQNGNIALVDISSGNIGIASTQPKSKFDINGTLSVSGISTFENITDNTLGNYNTGSVQIKGGLSVNKNLSVGKSFDVDGDAYLDVLNVSEKATFSSEIEIDSTGYLNVVGDGIGIDVNLSSAGGITTTGGDFYVGGDLYVKDDITFDSLSANSGEFFEKLQTKDLKATGITTLGNIKISSNIIDTVSGNLILKANDENNAQAIDIRNRIVLNNDTESTAINNGSLETTGGVGIAKNLNVGGNLSIEGNTSGIAVTIASAGGITTTGGDFYIGGDLYVKDDILNDELIANIGKINKHLTTKDLLVTGVSTFQGLVEVETGIVPDEDEGAYLGTETLPFSQAYIGEVQIAPGNNDNTVTTTSGNLVLDSQGGLIDINDNVDVSGTLDVTGATTLDSTLDVTGNATFDGNVDLGNANTDTVTFTARVDSNVIPEGDVNLGSDDNRWDIIYANNLNGILNITTQNTTTGNLFVTGVSTFQGLVEVETGIVPDEDEGAYLGTQLLPFSQAYIGEVQIAPGNNDNTVTTTSGNLVLDSQGGLIDINDNVDVSGTLDVTGNATFDGNVDLGNANTDTVTFAARVDSNILPSTNDTRDLGSSNLKWKEIYATSFIGSFTGNADTATALETARDFTISGDGTAPAVSFDGTANVDLVLTLENTGVTDDTYGNVSGTSYPRFTVDSKGRLTFAENVGIDFSTATVAQSDKIKVTERDTNAIHYLTFTSNDPDGSYEDLYGDNNLQYNPNNNDLSTNGDIVSGRGSGGVSLTINDGYGNANVTFNHQNGVPEQNGNSARIVCNTDSSTNATLDFQVKSGVSGGSAVGLTNIIKINEIGLRPSADSTFDLGTNSIRWKNIYADNITAEVTGNADTATTADNLAGGAAGSIPYQSAANTTEFLAEPNVNNRVLTYNNTTNSPQWSDLATLDGAGYNIDVIQTGGTDADPAIRLSDGANNDDITIVGGSNINVKRNNNSQLTISAVAGAGLAPNATIADIIDVNGGTISADDPGADRIFFWDDSEEKATHLSLGTGLQISGTTLSATSDAGKTYTLESVDSGSNAILRLSDGTNNDEVTITAGSNITINPVAAGGFTISAASLGDLGGISGIEVQDSGVSKGTDITALNFTGDISASASGNTATINVNIPTDVSDLTDTTGTIPTDVSDLTDTTGVIPTNISDLNNDSGYIDDINISGSEGIIVAEPTDNNFTISFDIGSLPTLP